MRCQTPSVLRPARQVRSQTASTGERVIPYGFRGFCCSLGADTLGDKSIVDKDSLVRVQRLSYESDTPRCLSTGERVIHTVSGRTGCEAASPVQSRCCSCACACSSIRSLADGVDDWTLRPIGCVQYSTIAARWAVPLGPSRH